MHRDSPGTGCVFAFQILLILAQHLQIAERNGLMQGVPMRAALVVVMGLVLGLALTVWTKLLFALPVMVLFGLIATWLQSRR